MYNRTDKHLLIYLYTLWWSNQKIDKNIIYKSPLLNSSVFLYTNVTSKTLSRQQFSIKTEKGVNEQYSNLAFFKFIQITFPFPDYNFFDRSRYLLLNPSFSWRYLRHPSRFFSVVLSSFPPRVFTNIDDLCSSIIVVCPSISFFIMFVLSFFTTRSFLRITSNILLL